MTSAAPYAEVIGDPISHSKSPLIHNFWLGKLGMEGEYRATQVGKDDLPGYLHDRRRDPAWRGCNVTMPLKQAALPFAGRLSDDVDAIGATNCLTPAGDGSLEAWNFDVAGVAVPLGREKKADYPKHVATYVCIIGAGGAARAASLGAARAGYGDFDIFVRDPARARDLAARMGTPFFEAQPLENLGPIRNPGHGPEDQRYSHIIINATPLGMRGQPEVPIDLGEFYSDTIVFDMVYDPLETGLLRRARELGMRTIDGLDMLIEQAGHGFRMFYGVEAPREHDPELRRLLTT